MSIRLKTAIAAMMVLAGQAALAQTPSADISVDSLSTDADLVFQGTVTNITYAASVEGIPHTFVTYKVEEVIKGSYRAPTLTLRFIGGVKIEGNVMRKLSVSHAPQFEQGQQDLLMVRGNTQTQCPLVRCAQGRFRFQQGMVTSEEGTVLAREPQGRVLALPPTQEQAGVGDFGSSGRSTAPAPANPLATPFDRAGFVAHVRDAVARQGVAAPALVQSADPSKPFNGPAPAVSGPPGRQRSALQRSSAASASQSEHDRQEIEALSRNAGNPVLPPKDVESLRRMPTPPTQSR